MKLPGFIDSHLHVLGLGYVSHNIDLTDVCSITELKSKFNTVSSDALIVARGWNQENFTEKRMINKTDLNEISNSVPIIAVRTCGHIIVVNDKMLSVAGIDAKTAQVEGGSFSVETGVFSENALALIYDKMPKPSTADLRKYFIKANEILLENGITSVASDDFSIFQIPFEKIIDIIKQLYTENLIQIRITEQVNLSYHDLQRFIQNGYVNKRFGRLRMGPLKILADGSLGGKTAYLKEPYADDPNNKGIRTYSDGDLFNLVHLADRNGMDVVIHAIGDAACEQAVVALTKSLSITKRMDHNHAIIHAQLTTKEQIRKMKQWNIGAIVQPIFLNSDIPMIIDRIGERSKESYLFKTMDKEGLTVGFSTDAPIEPVNPFWNIYSAMKRKSIKHPDAGTFLENEGFGYEQALTCYTTNNLRYIYEQQLPADDYIITDKEYSGSESLLEIQVVKTVIDGLTVYERNNVKE